MPLRKIKNLLHIPISSYELLSSIFTQKQFIKNELNEVLQLFERGKDETLSSKDFKKIKKYYALGVPGILGKAFSILNGHPITHTERLASTYQGALTGLFDDFFDDFDLPEVYLRKMIEVPESIETTKSNEALFLYLYKQCLKHVDNPALVKQYFNQVLNAQVCSLNQTKTETSLDEIKATTLFKGGISVVFYRVAYQQHMNPLEEAALYKLGGLMQLGNDIFDVYKDLQSGVRTLVTECNDIKELKRYFFQLLQEVYTEIYATDYDTYRIERFIQFLNLGIHRISVCLDQLEELQNQNGGIFQPEKHERKELICDMEKTGNLMKVVRYCVYGVN